MTNKAVDSSPLSKPEFLEDHHDAKDIGHDIWYLRCNTVYPIYYKLNTSITESNSIFLLIIKSGSIWTWLMILPPKIYW